MNFKVKKLIDSIQYSLDDTKRSKREDDEKLLKKERTKNTLFESGNEIINKTQDMFRHLEEMMSGEVSDISNTDVEFVEEYQENDPIIESNDNLSTDFEKSFEEEKDDQQ
ncbi:MAG: hypothetical protein KatS3mg035_1088 [Bacteroidia bacterium]|nr:MAG: hypothetical protein KatS3mg035_1088 [Bacteroidia bacterium]